MGRTIEMIVMTLLIILMAVVVGTTLTSCSSDDNGSDDNPFVICTEEYELYAIIDDPEGQRIDITPGDYVLTLDDIVSYNPDSGVLKVKGGQRIVDKAYPVPKQWRIEFYLNGHRLFGAWLNSLFSSLIGGTGLMLYHDFGDKDGYNYFRLTQMTIRHEDGVIEGELTEQEKAGLDAFEMVLKDKGKIDANLTWGSM